MFVKGGVAGDYRRWDDDPRLPVDLPFPWTRIEVEQNDQRYSPWSPPYIYRNNHTGREYSLELFEPRVLPEELEKRGVVLQDINLQ